MQLHLSFNRVVFVSTSCYHGFALYLIKLTLSLLSIGLSSMTFDDCTVLHTKQPGDILDIAMHEMYGIIFYKSSIMIGSLRRFHRIAFYAKYQFYSNVHPEFFGREKNKPVKIT